MISIVIYSKITSYKLIFFDDADLITKYSKVVEDNKPITYCLTDRFGEQYYRPMLSVSFYVNAMISGYDSSGYYVTNIILHVIAVLSIFLLFLKLKIPDIYSFLSCLLIAVHPIITPAVAWISGRNDPLLVIFTTLSFVFLIKWTEETSGEKKFLFALFHFLGVLFAVFTKESAIVLPVLFAVYILLFRKEKFNLKNMVLFGVFWTAIVTLFLILRTAQEINVSGKDIIGWQAFILNYPSIFAIIGKIFLPLKMSGNAKFESLSIITGILLILSSLVLIIKNRMNLDLRVLLFHLLWILAFLVPTLLIRLEYPHFDYLEHRSYIVIFSVLIIVFQILKSLNIDVKKPAFQASFAIIIVVFIFKTNAYTNTFSDRKVFQEAVIELYPESYTGYYNLGKAFDAEENFPMAKKYYEIAIQKEPTNRNIYIYMAGLFIKKKDPYLAEFWLRKAQKFDSTDVYVNWNLGRAYLLGADTSKAMIYFEKAIPPSSKNYGWISETAMNYLSNGKYEK
ncbi:MAG: hypothetical protein Q8M94_03940, partial [Ignavibacteria bacterium]|nr:hypothetical protein [Ignavibacteria bacterium]